ncbi:MAG: asparagine synthase C-terminal domain-containing protein, partial [Pseudomonadota bacterium]
FLSGGIDSSLLLAAMSAQTDQPVISYCAAFDDDSVPNEHSLAFDVAKECHAEYRGITVTFDDFDQSLPQICAAFDEPVADYAAIGLWHLACAAKADGIKVVLSGEGGDEIFGGYGRYRTNWWRDFMAKILPARDHLSKAGLGKTSTAFPLPLWQNTGLHADMPPTTRMQHLQSLDCQAWLPDNLLIKLDRMLMQHGVEGRTPFLDPMILPFYGLPDEWKQHKRLGKWILRDILSETLPQAQPFSKKRGFSVPVGAWIARIGVQLAPIISRDPALAPFIDQAKTEAFFMSPHAIQRHSMAAWRLVFCALWHRIHVMEVDARGHNITSLLAMK